MKHKYADTRLVAMVVVLGMGAACFGGGEEVADAQPSETLEASEERTSEEEAAGDEGLADQGGTERDDQRVIIEANGKLYAVHYEQRLFQCQCDFEAMGFETEDECIDTSTLGLADPEDFRECIIESLADIGEPPPIVHEYYACELNPLEPALQCMEEDSEAGYCKRAEEMGAINRVEACILAQDEDFDNCEDLRARAEAEAPQWMSEWSQERVRECMES